MSDERAGICDFCSAPQPTCLFSTAAATIALPGVDYVDVPGWWACALCATLIEADDRQALAERALRRLGGGDQSRRAITAAHGVFFRLRKADL